MEPSNVMQRLQSRREANRHSAHRRYHEKRVLKSRSLLPSIRDLILPLLEQQLIEQLRAEAAELKMQYNINRLFVHCSHPSQKTEDSSAMMDTLRRENAALRRRLQQFSSWECRLDLLLGQRQSTAPMPGHPQAKSRIRLKKPLSVEECHAIAREMYKEIVAISAEGSISTGTSVFGWTDQRRVENGQLKFALQKTFMQHSAYELASRTWALIRRVDFYMKLFSANKNVRYELVQEIDPNNVLYFQEYEVSAGDELIVMRSLMLSTQFETRNGFITLYYSIDPNRLERWPEDRDCVAGTTVKYQWQQLYGWTSSEVAGPNGEYCKSSYCGAIPTEDAGVGFWMVEVLLIVLRWENFVVRPLVTLVNDSVTSMPGEKSEH